MPDTAPTASAATAGDIVVGIDDSPASRAALSWAAEFARATGDRLRVIHVFSGTDGTPVLWTNGFPPMPFVEPNSSRANSENHLRRMFDGIHPEPSWTLEFREGSVGAELVDLSATARLLVVGTREHRGVERIVTGSVSHYCLNHSARPVAAVSPDMEPQRHVEESALTASGAGDAR